MPGKLTTHVLDTSTGKPAANLRIDLYRVDGVSRHFLKSLTTNSNGRTDSPVLEGLIPGATYELLFHAGDYFNTPSPRFLDQIPIRFSIPDPTSHYHVPLLVTPWSYSTYRGS